MDGIQRDTLGSLYRDTQVLAALYWIILADMRMDKDSLAEKGGTGSDEFYTLHIEVDALGEAIHYLERALEVIECRIMNVKGGSE